MHPTTMFIFLSSLLAGSLLAGEHSAMEFKGWAFLEWNTDRARVEQILKQHGIEVTRPDPRPNASQRTFFEYQGMETILRYSSSNMLIAVHQEKSFNLVHQDQSRQFFEKTRALLRGIYGGPATETDDPKVKVITLVWRGKHTEVLLRYDYGRKIIDELGEGSFRVTVDTSPSICPSP